MEFLLLSPALVLGFLLWRADRRYDQAQALLTATLDEWSEDRKNLLETYETSRKSAEESHRAEREKWTTERAQLLNRIQRPDTAVYENFEPSSLKQYAGFDNDAEAWEAVSGETVGDS